MHTKDQEVHMDVDLEMMARQQLEDFNRGDLEATRAVLSPDYVYEETGTGPMSLP
jgi:ketosteroid isomerase-like protein